MAETIKDQALRDARLVFYSEDIEAFNSELDGFLELSSARCVFLIDRDGHMVTRRGEPIESSMEAMSALIAGSFAATKELARLLGEEEFTTMFHQSQRENIQISLVGHRSLLAIVFDARTNLGLVRFYAQEATRRLEQKMLDIAERPQEDRKSEDLPDDFSASATAALDDIF